VNQIFLLTFANLATYKPSTRRSSRRILLLILNTFCWYCYVPSDDTQTVDPLSTLLPWPKPENITSCISQEATAISIAPITETAATAGNAATVESLMYSAEWVQSAKYEVRSPSKSVMSNYRSVANDDSPFQGVPFPNCLLLHRI
jgi:hypothetical protein